jgi:uncharacterized protein YbjT (DUF2867 family)
MRLVTNATGFIGRALVRRLAAGESDVRCLLRPSRCEQRLPTGIPFSTVSAKLDDLPALRTTMQGVTAIIHLTGEDDPAQVNMLYSHAEDTANLIEAAREAGVRRFVYVSRLGADRTSAYPVFHVMGEAETAVRESELDYTILQAAVTYGSEDAFTNVLVMLAKVIPFVVPLPEAGLSRFQPLWVEDLVTCILETIERDDLIGRTVPLGGPEHFTLEQMVLLVLAAAGVQRRLLRVRMPLIKFVIGLSDVFLLRNPVPPRWLDVLAVGSATELGAIARHFGFEPCRFVERLDYLGRKRPWRRDLLRFMLGYL